LGSYTVTRRRRNEKGSELFFLEAEDRAAPWLFDAVVHLAGEPIAGGRWNAARKRRIRDSRIEGTRSLCRTLAEQVPPPSVLVCASAIGFYGNRGDQLLDEGSAPGEGFLAEVVQSWEQAAGPAIQRGIRVAFLRFGMILSGQGGALGKMLKPFHYGLGGPIGDGRQYWSWITLDDAVGVVCHALTTDNLAGPVNVLAPHAVTNAAFTAALGQVLRRPTLARLPAWLARILLGQMADELLLASARAVPRRLTETGYVFHHAELLAALRHLLGR
jgi:uncharacterized protein (TIGR01777 family)